MHPTKATVHFNSCCWVLTHDQLHMLEGFLEPWLRALGVRVHILR